MNLKSPRKPAENQRQPDSQPETQANSSHVDTPATMSPSVGKKPKMDKEAIAASISLAKELLIKVDGEAELKREMRLRYRWGAARTAKLITKIYSIWQREALTSKGMNQIRAVKRISNIGEKAYRQGKLTNALEAEALIARIQGTETAVTTKIDVNVGAAMAAVLGAMSVERMGELAEQHKKLIQQAASKALPAHIPDADIEPEEK